MATKVLNTRIRTKYDTYANWSAANPVLLAGEIAVVIVPAATGAVTQEPAILIKVGDGAKAFNELGWVSATAADVYDWAKADKKPTYAASEITGLGTAIDNYVKDTMGITTDTNTVYKVEVSDDGRGVKLFAKAAAEADTSYTLQNTVTLTGFVKAITTGTTNGTIAVDGTDIAVKGLGSAAFAETGAFDAAGDANAVKTALEGKIGTVTEGKTVVEMIDDAKKAATYDDSTLKNRVKTLEDDTRVATLVGEDAGKSARAIANEELVKQLIPENAKDSLDTLSEIAAWIQKHPDDASAMNAEIAALKTAIGEGGSVDAQITAKINALDLENTYDAKGTAAAAQEAAASDAKTKADAAKAAAIADAEGKIATAKTEAITTAKNAADAAYVAKVEGKALSTNDFDNDAKEKLGAIEAGAQVNKIETIKVNGVAQAIADKAVDLKIVTNIDNLEQTENTYVIFDCGSATKNI